MRKVILCALACAFAAEAQIAAPQPGFARYDQLSIQTLFGVPGSFVFGQPQFGAAEAASFSDNAALLAGNGSIQLIRKDGLLLATETYSGSAPIVSVTGDPATALAWLPRAHALLTYTRQGFCATGIAPGSLPGTVTSVALISSKWASLLLTQADGSVARALISLPRGDVMSVDALPGVEAPAYRFGNYLLWRDDRGLEIEDMNGQHQTLAAPAAGFFTAEQMSSQWIHLFFPAENTHWALQLHPAAALLSRLPAPPHATEGTRP